MCRMINMKCGPVAAKSHESRRKKIISNDSSFEAESNSVFLFKGGMRS